MSTSTLRRAALAAAMAGMGVMGGAEIVPREYAAGPSPDWTAPARRMGNNRPAGPTRAEKKRRRKISRASLRFNLRRAR